MCFAALAQRKERRDLWSAPLHMRTARPPFPASSYPHLPPLPAGAYGPRSSRLLIGRRRAPAASRLALRHVRLMLLGAGGQRRGGGHGRGPGGAGRGGAGSIGPSPEVSGVGPPRGLPRAGLPPPGGRRKSRGRVLTCRPFLRSVTGQGASVRWPGRASPGCRLGLCQAGRVAAVGPDGRESAPLAHVYVWYRYLLGCHS